jgi:hypothetical protein
MVRGVLRWAVLAGVLLTVAVLPASSAQGGSGEIKVWIEPVEDRVQVPLDSHSAEVPLRIRGLVSNITCPFKVRWTFALHFDTPPENPFWANASYGPRATASFILEGDYWHVNGPREVQAEEARVLRLNWIPTSTPVNATWVYRLIAGGPVSSQSAVFPSDTPVAQVHRCVLAPAIKPQGPTLLSAYLEGGAPAEAPAPRGPRVTTLLPTTASDDVAAPAATTQRAEDEGAGLPAPPVVVALLAALGAVLLRRRRA